MRHILIPFSLTLITTLLTACASTVGSTSAPTPTPPACDDALVIYCAGLDDMLVDDRDQGLKRALLLVDDRLKELPSELEFEAPPESAMALATRVFTGPKEFRIGLLDRRFPIYAQLRLPEANADAAHETENLVADLIEEAGGHFSPPVAARDALQRVSLEPAMGLFAWFGVPASADDEFLVALSQASAGAADIGSPGLPEGVEPIFTLMADGEALVRLGETIEVLFPGEGGSSDSDASVQLTIGTAMAELTTTLAVGRDEDRTHMASVIWDYRPILAEKGLLVESHLSIRLLEKIPADAVFVMAGTTNMSSILDIAMATVQEQVLSDTPFKGDPLVTLAMFTGLHLRRDLFDHLGQSWGVWISNTGGGGGFLSGVAVVELANEETIAETFGRIRTLANGVLRMQTEGYVRMRHWEHGDLELGTLTFPGLPVPLEVTCAVSEGFAWFGLTPQAVIGSVQHAASGGPRLMDRLEFYPEDGPLARWVRTEVVQDLPVRFRNSRRSARRKLKGLSALTFLDTPALMADGYGMATLAASALANATRSPRKRKRDAGLILPSYSELRHGARPFLALTRWEGDHLVTRAQADRSLVANLTGIAGLLSRTPLPYLIPGVVGALLGSQRAGEHGGDNAMPLNRSHTLKIGLGIGTDGAHLGISLEDED